MSQGKEQNKKDQVGSRVLNAIERAGNKLPHPVALFMIFSVIVMVVSFLVAKSGTSGVNPSTGDTVTAVNILSKEGLQGFLGSITGNFQGYPPLGLVLVVMFGAGLADKTGLMTATIKQAVLRAPDNLVTAIIVFLGINAVAVGDAGFVVLPPLAAAVYYALGRHPLAGLYTAFASVAGGFAASIMVQMGDVVAASFTVPAAQMIDPTYSAGPAMNYYFMIISTFIILPAGVWVNNKIIEPRLGEYKGGSNTEDDEMRKDLTDVEKKALGKAGITVLIIIAIIVALSIGEGAFMKDPETGSLLTGNAALMTGIVPLVTILFLIPALVYGIGIGLIKSDKDVVRLMSQSISEMGGYIVLAFSAAQFLALFKTSNLGPLLAIKGSEFLEGIGLTGFGAVLALILLTALINMFIGSAGAKWGILAPIFVPMFMLIGLDPALTQAAYRIGDSITNCISPLNAYMAMMISFAQKYQKDAGFGTLIANLLPFSVTFFIVWVIVLAVFMFFNIPLGPGGGIFI